MKPLLACEVPIEKINFPVYASIKLDGIRCLAIDGVAVSRSLKPIRNKFIQDYFKEHNLDGLDGELCVGDNFQDSTSGIMSGDGEPNFTYHVFDYWKYPMWEYTSRLSIICDFVWPERVQVLEQNKCNTEGDIRQFYNMALLQGCEGIILRSLYAPYKYGRSTPKEQYLMKIKPHEDSEAIIIGFEEQLENTNEITTNKLGLSERSTAKEGMVGKNTLGAFIVESPEFGQFTVGSGRGLTQVKRQEIWDKKDMFIGKLIKFKYQLVGVKDKPRFPIFLGFRDKEDL